MGPTFTRRDIIRQTQRLALATPFLSLIACDDGAARPVTVINGATMGTTYGVKIPSLPAAVDRETLAHEITEILEAVNAQMSTYRSDSELSLFNAAMAAKTTAVSPDTLTVVENALAASRLAGGAFDPTIGPLVDLWGFGPDGRRPVPSPDRVADAVAAIGYRHVHASGMPPSLGKGRNGIRLDLSGIAKGFGVDRVAEHLERAGVEYYLVEIGGELRGRGYSSRGDVWRVGIERPVAAQRSVQRVVRIGGEAMATSGDYRIFFEQDGARYSHIIDPRVGRPVDHGLASVTVIASSAMRADALSTALMVLGPDAGLELARQAGIAAFFIAKLAGGFTEIVTPEFKPYLIA